MASAAQRDSCAMCLAVALQPLFSALGLLGGTLRALWLGNLAGRAVPRIACPLPSATPRARYAQRTQVTKGP